MGRGFYPHSSINCGLCRESTTVVLVPFKTVTQETYEEGMDFVVKVRVTPDFSKWMDHLREQHMDDIMDIGAIQIENIAKKRDDLRVAAALRLHRRVCRHCGISGGRCDHGDDMCSVCVENWTPNYPVLSFEHSWPCPTVKALTGVTS